MAERLVDGMPGYVLTAEEELVGSAMLADAVDVQIAAIIVSADDFRDPTLGVIWQAIVDVDVPVLPAVCDLLNQREQLDEVGDERRLAGLVARPGAFLYAGGPQLEANAALVHKWAEARRVIAAQQAVVRDALDIARAAGAGQIGDVKPLYERPEYQGEAV